MSIELLEHPVEVHNPLEMLEHIALSLDYECELVNETELHVVIAGAWRDVGIWFTWRPELCTLQMGAPLDLKVPNLKMLDAARLVTLVNERLWAGHFDLWSEDQELVFRNSAILSQNVGIDSQQADILMKSSMEAVERFYPAFNFLIWGDKSPEDALRASMYETVGNA